MSRTFLPLAWVFTALALSRGAAQAQAFNDYELTPHDYFERELTDPMTRLLERVEAGELSLGEERGKSLVRMLLKELDIPEASQVVVFSRTSLQREQVGPANPRAMYFNEDIYLGWMPGGRIEIASMDPKAGAVFFYENRFDPEAPAGQKTGFDKPGVCLQCHGGSATNYLPGLLGRSVYPSLSGGVLANVTSFDRVGHAIPIADRWGGWYVTGSPRGAAHMGNGFGVRGKTRTDVSMREDRPLSVDSLNAFFDLEKYPRGTSDMLALMVFDHQVEMHNLLIEAHYKTRIAEFEAEGNAGVIPAVTHQEMLDIADKTVRYLLFKDEAEFPRAGLAGDDSFKKAFLQDRGATIGGRSLREFDLKTRLFKYRCSFMIGSNSFTGLPARMKSLIYERLWKILSPANPPTGWEYLDRNERRAIIGIIAETKSDDLPDYWKATP